MAFWETVNESGLRQGDLLPSCIVPDLPTDFWDGVEVQVNRDAVDLIIATQSCDLDPSRKRIRLVSLCRIYSMQEFQPEPWTREKKKKLDSIRQGRSHYVHLLGSVSDPTDPFTARVVDFRDTFALPLEYLAKHAERLGERHRLLSPYREHFSQAYARYYMRVGLPSDIPSFTA